MPGMKLKVRSIGLVRQALGPDLLHHLAELKGEKFAPFAVEPKQPNPYAPLRVVLNGRDVGPAEHRECTLAEGDDLLLFLPIAGG
jgi:ThiS family